MKKYLAIMLCLFSLVAQASQTATTDKGDVVILNDDGTWKYQNAETATLTAIKTNSNTFVKSPAATFFLKSTRNKAAFWIDPQQWNFRKAPNTKPAEYEFELKGKDLYGMAITEGIGMSLESLGQIAFDNAKQSAPDVRIVAQEYRTVNGIKVLYQQMNGTIKGIKFSYVGYYFSDATGSTQFLVYTSTNLIEKYKSEIESFLNGLTMQG